WYPGEAPIAANPTFVNTGFGVSSLQASYPTPAGRIGVPFAAPCDGHYATRCNYSEGGELVMPTSEMAEGVNNVWLYAYSPSGNGSTTYHYPYMVDRKPPSSIVIEGELAGKEN